MLLKTNLTTSSLGRSGTQSVFETDAKSGNTDLGPKMVVSVLRASFETEIGFSTPARTTVLRSVFEIGRSRTKLRSVLRSVFRNTDIRVREMSLISRPRDNGCSRHGQRDKRLQKLSTFSTGDSRLLGATEKRPTLHELCPGMLEFH